MAASAARRSDRSGRIIQQIRRARCPQLDLDGDDTRLSRTDACGVEDGDGGNRFLGTYRRRPPSRTASANAS